MPPPEYWLDMGLGWEIAIGSGVLGTEWLVVPVRGTGGPWGSETRTGTLCPLPASLNPRTHRLRAGAHRHRPRACAAPTNTTASTSLASGPWAIAPDPCTTLQVRLRTDGDGFGQPPGEPGLVLDRDQVHGVLLVHLGWG